MFDEVDTCYEATLRTSACRRLAQLCPLFVAQTATPMVKTVEHLVGWLASTEQCVAPLPPHRVGASPSPRPSSLWAECLRHLELGSSSRFLANTRTTHAPPGPLPLADGHEQCRPPRCVLRFWFSWIPRRYPVTKHNFLVAASGMVATQISLNIEARPCPAQKSCSVF